MPHIYNLRTREEYVTISTQYDRVNQMKTDTGCSKEYLNKLRGYGCSRGQCPMCRSHPVHKSLKKAKGFMKDKKYFDFEYNDNIWS